jgi:hypothetical protein
MLDGVLEEEAVDGGNVFSVLEDNLEVFYLNFGVDVEVAEVVEHLGEDAAADF